LRFRAIGVSTLFLDDAWVAVGARFPTVGDTIGAGLTSPGFSLVYRAWSAAFGDGATTAQLLTVGFAVAAPVVLFLAAAERGLPKYAALLGAGLLATAPAHIDMSTRMKQYTAEALVATLLLWAAWRILDRPSPGRWAVCGGVAIAASFVSTVGAVASAAALGSCLLAALLTRPRRLSPAIVTCGAFVMVVLPWTVLAVQPNVFEKLTDYWRGYYLDGSGFAGGLYTRMSVLANGFQGIRSVAVLVVLGAAACFVLFRRPFLGVLLVSPTFVAIGLAALTVVPLGTGRTDVYLFPSLALLIAVAVAELAAMVPARARTSVALVAVVAFVASVALAEPALDHSTSKTRGPCPDPPVEGSTLLRCPYPLEDLGPLVRFVESHRRAGDKILVYPSSGYAYGLATRYGIEKRDDPLAATGWVVKVNGPDVVILQAHREDPEKWTGPLDRLAARSPRVWLLGSHFFPDWRELGTMLMRRGYRVGEFETRQGAAALLFFKEPVTSPANEETLHAPR
jgi:hypothetical protein